MTEIGSDIGIPIVNIGTFGIELVEPCSYLSMQLINPAGYTINIPYCLLYSPGVGIFKRRLEEMQCPQTLVPFR